LIYENKHIGTMIFTINKLFNKPFTLQYLIVIIFYHEEFVTNTVFLFFFFIYS